MINPFLPSSPFLYPLKTSENRKVNGVKDTFVSLTMVAMKTGKTIFQFIIEMVAKRKKGFIKNTNLIGTYYH